MKKLLIFALTMLVSVAINAQEKMKVVLTDGTTSEFEVKKISRVYFEGQDITITTGSATNVTSNSATVSYSIAGASGNVSAGIIASKNSNLTYENCQSVYMSSSPNGTYSAVISGLSPSTTCYYRAFALVSGSYIYGDVRSFTTTAATPSIIYEEPYTSWGASMSQTKNYMKGYTLNSEDATRLIYAGKYQEELIMYGFENSKLIDAAVAVRTTKTTQAKIETQIKSNGYSYVTTASDGSPMYLSSDGKTVVVLQTNSENGYYIVLYYDYEWLMNQNKTKLYEEPYIVWGTARSTVKSKVSNMGYTLAGESTSASNGYYLAYKGKNKEIQNEYYFNSQQQLSEVDVIFLASDVSLDDARNYLASDMSYTFKGTNSAKTQFFYLTPDGNSYAIAYNATIDNTIYTIVFYVSFDSVSSGAPQRAANASQLVFETIDTPSFGIDIKKAIYNRIARAYEQRSDETSLLLIK